MHQPPRLAWDLLLELGPSDDSVLHRELATALREAIATGALAPGSRLPSSRMLASDLDCSRWVVTEAYGQLTAEGYLVTRPGAGTYVAEVGAAPMPRLELDTGPVPLDLVPGLPDLRAFPRRAWLRASRAVLDDTSFTQLAYPQHAGHPRLREQLGSYLVRTRGAAIDHPDQVSVTHGVADTVGRLARAFGPGSAVGVEEPGWTRLHERIGHAGGRPVPIPVDDGGIDVDALAASDVRLVVVAAAHQFPTGVAVSPERRDELVAWARARDGLVIEDDYDAEFRYDRAPLPVLQASAPDHVVLLGSTSKTLAPAVGLGWMVAPDHARELLGDDGRPAPTTLAQLALARLFRDGAYDRHLRTRRAVYGRRRELLLAELGRRLPAARISGEAAGLHLLLHLPSAVSAHAVVDRAQHRGMRLSNLDDYRTEADSDDTLVLGYANLHDSRVTEAVAVLAELVRDPQA